MWLLCSYDAFNLWSITAFIVLLMLLNAVDFLSQRAFQDDLEIISKPTKQCLNTMHMNPVALEDNPSTIKTMLHIKLALLPINLFQRASGKMAPPLIFVFLHRYMCTKSDCYHLCQQQTIWKLEHYSTVPFTCGKPEFLSFEKSATAF